jgi:hypothetical protein
MSGFGVAEASHVKSNGIPSNASMSFKPFKMLGPTKASIIYVFKLFKIYFN